MGRKEGGNGLCQEKSRKENIFVNGMTDELIMATLPECVYRTEEKNVPVS